MDFAHGLGGWLVSWELVTKIRLLELQEGLGAPYLLSSCVGTGAAVIAVRVWNWHFEVSADRVGFVVSVSISLGCEDTAGTAFGTKCCLCDSWSESVAVFDFAFSAAAVGRNTSSTAFAMQSFQRAHSHPDLMAGISLCPFGGKAGCSAASLLGFGCLGLSFSIPTTFSSDSHDWYPVSDRWRSISLGGHPLAVSSSLAAVLRYHFGQPSLGTQSCWTLKTCWIHFAHFALSDSNLDWVPSFAFEIMLVCWLLLLVLKA